jgi:hypothetical protein
MTRRHLLFTAGAAGAAAAASNGSLLILSWNFNAGSHGWLPGFSEYNRNNPPSLRLAEIRPLPAEVNRPAERGYYMHTRPNTPGSFMYLKNEIGTAHGVEPGRLYWPSMHIQYATDIPSGCAWIASASASPITLRAGVAAIEPSIQLVEPYVRLDPSPGYLDAAGTVTSNLPCETGSKRYVLAALTMFQRTPVRADMDGRLWLIAGTSTSSLADQYLYYYTIGVVLQPA